MKQRERNQQQYGLVEEKNNNSGGNKEMEVMIQQNARERERGERRVE